MAKQNIYDDEVFFEHFRTLREDEINFNDVIETPIITSMLPDLKGKKVLDIGCGMGQHARQYAQMGAASVLGTDISEKCLPTPPNTTRQTISTIAGWRLKTWTG